MTLKEQIARVEYRAKKYRNQAEVFQHLAPLDPEIQMGSGSLAGEADFWETLLVSLKRLQRYERGMEATMEAIRYPEEDE